MAPGIWVLVEWTDLSNVLPIYDMVHVDSSMCSENDLVPGNSRFFKLKHENPKRAKIVKVSVNKQHLLEHKEMLERQNEQLKNMLQICMQTITNIRSESSINPESLIGSQTAPPHVVVATKPNNDSDSDSEPEIRRPRSVNNTIQVLQTYTPRPPTQSNHRAVAKIIARPTIKRILQSCQPNGMPIYTECFFSDQGTQTEAEYLGPLPSHPKIQRIEAIIKELSSQLENLASRINIVNGPPSISGSEHNGQGLYAEPTVNELWAEHDNPENLVDELPPGNIDDNVTEQANEENEEDQRGSAKNMTLEENSNTLRVRRMSAQTTNNVEAISSNDSDLVPIGHGYAKVPMRLLNEIDWNWHTSATRQLLQAVFPRKVLATHSLTGKQSPAFMNRPPKKILDPKLVEDIVMTVSTECGVTKNLVRNTITIKCTDEAKLFRNRQQYKQGRKSQQNEENVPPSPTSSDESANAVMH